MTVTGGLPLVAIQCKLLGVTYPSLSAAELNNLIIYCSKLVIKTAMAH